MHELDLCAEMLHAVLDVLGGKEKHTTLREVGIGGAAVTPKHIWQLREEPGAQKACCGFGMTEGSPVRFAGSKDPRGIVRGENVAAGSVCAGSHIRICAQGTRDPVPRGIPGELHQGGSAVVTEYLDRGRTEDFYTNQRGYEWFNTGDQAIIDEEGLLYIVGRDKDMIIRRGESIAPTSMEKVLNGVNGVDVRIAGIQLTRSG